MATTNMKRIVGESIVSYITTNIPSLAGKMRAVQAGPETNLPTATSATLMPQVFTYEPSNYDEVYYKDPDDGKVVYEVGQFTGLYQLELYAKTSPEREQIEQQILDLFLADPWAPGTLILATPALTINGYVSLYSAEIKARLDTEQWYEFEPISGHRFVYLDILVDFPATIALSATTIQHLDIDFSSDFDAVITDSSQLPATDKVEVQQDGSTTQATT